MSTRKVILLDVDGVVADFVGAYLEVANRTFERAWSAEDVTEWNVYGALGIGRLLGALVSKRLVELGADSLEPYADALRVVPALIARADVYFVTAPMSKSMTWMREREVWLERHFGRGVEKRVLHVDASAKHLVRGDIFVEDRPATVEAWANSNPGGLGILRSRPWNRSSGWMNQIGSLDEVLTYLEER